MRVGINWISPASYGVVQKLLNEGIADFCEVVVDNFAHLPASTIKKLFPQTPLTLHIVGSHFLARKTKELQTMAEVLAPWIAELDPLIVSDHILSVEKPTPFPIDADYASLDEIIAAIRLWESFLGRPIHVENHASLTLRGKAQANFFSALQAQGVKCLFDFSNAYIADYNAVCSFNSWRKVLQQCHHFHVAGCTFDATNLLALDTHDTALHAEVIQLLEEAQSLMGDHTHKTIVVEFDAHLSYDLAQSALLRVKKIFARAC